MVARDLDIDYGARGDASGEEDRGKFDLSSEVGRQSTVGSRPRDFF